MLSRAPGALSVGGVASLNGNVTIGSDAADRLTVKSVVRGGTPLVFDGPTAGGNKVELRVPDVSAPRVITVPDANATLPISATTITVCLSGCHHASLSSAVAWLQDKVLAGMVTVQVRFGVLRSPC